jgi:hypothetical protein
VRRDSSLSMHDYLEANAKRYQEIKHLADRVKFVSSGYAHKMLTVRLDDETKVLSDLDLVVLCDGGNACFGGAVGARFGESVSVEVYTD